MQKDTEGEQCVTMMLPSENLRTIEEQLLEIADGFDSARSYRPLPADTAHAAQLLYMLDAADILRSCGFPVCERAHLSDVLNELFSTKLKSGRTQYFQTLRCLLERKEYTEHLLSLLSESP